MEKNMENDMETGIYRSYATSGLFGLNHGAAGSGVIQVWGSVKDALL